MMSGHARGTRADLDRHFPLPVPSFPWKEASAKRMPEVAAPKASARAPTLDGTDRKPLQGGNGGRDPPVVYALAPLKPAGISRPTDRQLNSQLEVLRPVCERPTH